MFVFFFDIKSSLRTLLLQQALGQGQAQPQAQAQLPNLLTGRMLDPTSSLPTKACPFDGKGDEKDRKKIETDRTQRKRVKKE